MSRIDHSYAFATPHRLTVALPDSAHKTLLDVSPGALRMAWTYDSIARFPLGAYAFPQANWELQITPAIDGLPFGHSSWTRLEGDLPILLNRYSDVRGEMVLTVAGGPRAAVGRIDVTNQGERPHRFSLRVEKPGRWNGANPGWVDPDLPADNLQACWLDRSDRVIILGLGADAYPLTDANSLTLQWTLGPGETRSGWLVRPYAANAPDLPALRAADWAAELAHARRTWRSLLDRAAVLHIPDAGVERAYYACLADLFVMREPVADGRIVPEPGTEIYRAPGTVEGALVSVALDQAGLVEQAAGNLDVALEMQGEDGDWNDPRGWGHLMWCVAGFKSWAVMEHYHLTRDRAYLERLYPRMLANARWQARQRARTRVLAGGERPATYGLMPKGMGDCGLKDGDDLYGVYLPHNIWAVYADKLAVEAAQILGREADAAELRAGYLQAHADLLAALERGAIDGEGYRWIPGVPGKTSGSRWGALNVLFPCGLLPGDHPLVEGTLQHLERNMSPGGINMNTGWLTDGMWVAISLDNVAEAHLARGEGDAAVEYLYATLNHGTPLITWCEERGPEPGAAKVTGDRQHQFTPVAVCRAVRDCLVMEEGDGLHLARGAARAWLAGGEPLGIEGAPTHFGPVSYRLQYDEAGGRVQAEIRFAPDHGPAWATVHVRLPRGLRVTAVEGAPGAAVATDGQAVRLDRPRGLLRFGILLGDR